VLGWERAKKKRSRVDLEKANELRREGELKRSKLVLEEEEEACAADPWEGQVEEVEKG